MNKRIKTIGTLITIALLMLSCQSNKEHTLNIKGSDTVLPLTQELIEAYEQEDPTFSIAVTGGGSGVGLTALLNGTTDIAQSSREIKFEEQLKLENKGQKATEVILAYDALSVIVHPENPVSELTREQLEGIFTGKIENWKEVGGEDLEIIPYARETSSGTYEFFKEVVLEHKNYKDGIMSMPATGGILQSVSQTKGAIGYVGLAYVSSKVKSLAVSFDAGATYVEASAQNTQNKTYPIARPLYYYYTNLSEGGAAFVDYVLSQKGKQVIAKVGYVSID